MNRAIKRGDIVSVDLDPVAGSEQGGSRPALVVQNDIGNEHSPTIIIAPITGSLNKQKQPTHVKLPTLGNRLNRDSYMLAEQIRAVDRCRINKSLGRVEGKYTLASIDRALAVSIGIYRPEPNVLFLSLCYRCEWNFRDSGMILVKKRWQEQLDYCDFCREGYGLAFGIFNK
jgi:mRNA interferase MazF